MKDPKGLTSQAERWALTSLAEHWALFAERVLAQITNPVQRQEMRRAFYAGAGAGLMLVDGVSDLSDEEAAKRLTSFATELAAFGAELAAGRA